jgi:hypothetical protein
MESTMAFETYLLLIRSKGEDFNVLDNLMRDKMSNMHTQREGT